MYVYFKHKILEYFWKYRVATYTPGVKKNLQKWRSHLKILGSRRETRSKFHAHDPQIIGAIVQNLVVHDLYTPECQRLKNIRQ